jgi:hypothetical protein
MVGREKLGTPSRTDVQNGTHPYTPLEEGNQCKSPLGSVFFGDIERGKRALALMGR